MESDEEYERRPRGRDKFRRERSDYNERSGGGGGRRDERSSRRDDNNWSDRSRRQVWGDSRRKEYRDFDRERRDSGGRHHDMSPPMKKVRRDWDNSGYQQGGDFGGYHPMQNQWMPQMELQQHNVHQRQFENDQPPPQHQQQQQQQMATDMAGGPVMMTFKQFLNSMEDNIDDMEAVKKYQEYKVEFRKTQIADFFTTHKDEEWFRNKYHPDDSVAYQKKLNNAIRKRAKVFLDLLQSDWINKFSLTAGSKEDITKLLDAAVIKFEGGTDLDLQVLDQTDTAGGDKDAQHDGKAVSVAMENKEGSKESGITPISPSALPLPETPAPARPEASKPEDGKAMEVSETNTEQTKPKEGEDKNEKSEEAGVTHEENEKKRKRKRRHREPHYYDENAESESESESDIEPESAPPADEAKEGAGVAAVATEDAPPGVETEPISGSEDTPTQPGDSVGKEETTVVKEPEMKVDESSGVEKASEEQKDEETKDADVKKEKNQNADEKFEPVSPSDSQIQASESVVEEIKTPRPLHLTASLFVRSVPPKISHYDIESACCRFPGFMRVVLSDASPERKFSRRGWITFKPDVNIKDICWTINNMKIRDIELNPIVNRELARRVRTVSGAAVLKKIVEVDITLAKKLIDHLDQKYQVWNAKEGNSPETTSEVKKVEEQVKEKSEDISVEKESEEIPDKSDAKCDVDVVLPDANPLLESLQAQPTPASADKASDKVTKSGDAEGQEDEEGQVVDDGEIQTTTVVDDKSTEILAPDIDAELVKTLDRLVLYLRIVHSLDYYNGAEYLYEDDMPNRCGIVHIRNSLPEKINYEEVNEWHKNLHLKLEQHLKKPEHVSNEEALQLGKKDPVQETEKFVQANTQELAKDKWLCPLSGKKFRGPEFVKKHIFNKHADKLEGVKTEVAFFNNFVHDSNRPSVPDAKQFQAGGPNQSYQGGGQFQIGMQANMGWGRGMIPQGRGGFVQNMSGNFRSDNFNRGQSFQMKPKRGGMRRDPRQIVQYRDLDAPGDEMEFF